MGRALTACLCHGERSRGDLGYSSSLQYLESWGIQPHTSSPWSRLVPRLVLQHHCSNTTRVSCACRGTIKYNQMKWGKPNKAGGLEALLGKGDSVREPSAAARGNFTFWSSSQKRNLSRKAQTEAPFCWAGKNGDYNHSRMGSNRNLSLLLYWQH